MNKNKKMLLALVLMFLLAIIAGFMLYFYLTPAKTTVYMFNDNYSAGTMVTDSMLTSVQVDSTITVGGSATGTNTRFVTGQDKDDILRASDTLRMDVSSGMPLTYSMLTTAGGSSIEMSMNSENVAVTIAANESTGITSDIQDNSHINVYATGWGGTTGTTLIFQNLRVLSIFL